jgi:hypothetical protein
MTSFLLNRVRKKLGTYGGIWRVSESSLSEGKTYLAVVVGNTPEHEVCKPKRHHGERPSDIHDRSGNNVLERVNAVERIAPVPQCGDWVHQHATSRSIRATHPRSAATLGRYKHE